MKSRLALTAHPRALASRPPSLARRARASPRPHPEGRADLLLERVEARLAAEGRDWRSPAPQACHAAIAAKAPQTLAASRSPTRRSCDPK
jgi:hypothetical protein